MVFVNYYAYSATALVFKAADDTAVAINLDIATRTYNVSGKKYGEIDQRTDGNIAIHGEEHAVGGDVLRFCSTSSGLRLDLNWKVQGKARRTLHFCIVLDGRLLFLRVDRHLLLWKFA
jgi:hypothetical protein